jgi:hypothetical protein
VRVDREQPARRPDVEPEVLIRWIPDTALVSPLPGTLPPWVT